MEFYNRLVYLCNQRGITVTALLQRMGLSTSKGTAWKNGSVPRADVITRLAAALETSSSYLLGETENPSPSKSAIDNFDEDTKKILQLCADNPDLAKKLLDIAKMLTSK